MSKVTEIDTDDGFRSHISSLPSSTIVVISFYAPWAAPCKQMRVVLETLASSYPPQDPPTISFISLDAEEVPDISEIYDVTAVPFLVLQRDGKVLENISGNDASKIRDTVEKYVGKAGSKEKLALPTQLEVTPRMDGNEATGLQANKKSAVTNGNTTTPNPESSGAVEDQDDLNKRLEELVKAAPVMLFMKGTPSSPQCGFSRQLVGLLRENGVRYGFFNILADEDVRQGLKVFSDWPTFPQLYLNGELVGGLDIVKEELENDAGFFKEYQAAPKGKPSVEVPKEPQAT